MNTAPKPIRSPSYPNMALSEAIVEVGKIEKLYRSSPVDRTVAAKLIGYSSLSGPANKALASLAMYGFLDRAGKGETRVTERARDILHADSPAQRNARLFEAAMEPSLFRELRERFEGIPVPPEDGVITYLNRQGFNPNAVRPAAKAFLETVRYLEEIGATESHGVARAEGANTPEIPTPEIAMQTRNTEHLGPEANRLLDRLVTDIRRPALLQETFNLDEGPVTLTFPEKMSVASYEDLEAHLQIFLRKAKRRADALRQFNADSGDPDTNELG